MKKFLLAACAATVATFAPMTASAGDITGSVSLDYVTDYVFRGYSLAGDALQPGIELAVGNFYGGIWGSTPLGTSSALGGDEIDFYVGYGFGLSDTVSADLGLTYYHYPQAGDFLSEDAGTYELYGGLSFDMPLAPSLYAYYDWTLEAFTVEGAVGHSFAMSENLSLDLGATAGVVSAPDDAGWEYGQVSASLGFPIGGAVGGYVGVNYALSSDESLGWPSDDDLADLAGFEQDKGLFFAGAGISADF